MNSGSAETTRAPSGSEDATRPTMVDVLPPTAIQSVGTPTSLANEARALSVNSPQPSKLVRAARQSASTAWSVSQAVVGGSPKLAVFR